MSEGDKDRGLYAKYDVRRIHDPNGKHDNCRFFVLDPEHDPMARRALRMYQVQARARGYVELSSDIRHWLSDVYRRHIREE